MKCAATWVLTLWTDVPIRYIEYGTEVVLLDVTGIEPSEALYLGRQVRRELREREEVTGVSKRFRMVRGILEHPTDPIRVADPAGSLDPPEPTVREAAGALWRAIRGQTQPSAP